MTQTDAITHSIVDRYLASWNETDHDDRRTALAATWSPACRFTDPLADVTGHDELAAFMDGVQAHYPGHRFELSSAIDTHHHLVRFTWDLVGPDGVVAAVGHDTLTLDDAGHITTVTGFFGPLSPGSR